MNLMYPGYGEDSIKLVPGLAQHVRFCDENRNPFVIDLLRRLID